jgi:hypothetical protein
MPSKLHNLMAAARAAGAAATHVSRVSVYGHRDAHEVPASVALDAHSAKGVGPRSVFQGPTHSRSHNGAPMLRRQRSA